MQFMEQCFRISINDKIKSYGQLRTIGATPKQIKRIVKREGRKLGSIGILIGTVLGVCGGFLLFPKGFNAVSYVATIILTLISSWIMVSVSIRKPIKIAAGISPIEAVRFTPAQKDIRSRKKNIKLNPVSMGIANFKRDRKKTVAIVASLSLGGIILLVVSSIVLLRSPEALARRFFPDGDYKIYLDSEMTEEKVMAAGNPLNEELKQEILSIDGVTDIISSRQSLYATLKTDIYQSGGMCDMLTDQNYATVEAALTAGTMPKDSRSIVIDYNVLKQNEDMGVGSTVDFYFGEGQPPVSVTVSGLFDSNKTPSGHGKLALDGVLFFAPEDTLDHNIAADQNNGNHASHQCKIKGFRSIGKILAVHFGHRKLIFLRNLPAIRGHQFFAQLVAVFEMDIGAIASRVKPVPFCQGSVGKNDSAGIRFFFIYAVHNAGNDIITMKTLCI